MVFLSLLSLAQNAMAEDNFISIRKSLAPGARTHGQVDAYSLGVGFIDRELEYVISFDYAQNVQFAILDESMPHAVGPSIRFQFNLVSYSNMKLYFSEKIGLLVNIANDEIPFILEQNAGIGFNILIYENKGNPISLSPEMGVIPILWAPYFSLEAQVAL